MAEKGKSEEEIKAQIDADWEWIQRSATTPGSVPLYRPQESKSEKAARTPRSKNPVLEDLKKKHPDWPELQ